MTFLAYAPYRLPHSEETLQKQLAEQGLEYKKWRSNVIRRTKMKILRDFLTQILKPLFSFGENCFQVGSHCNLFQSCRDCLYPEIL